MEETPAFNETYIFSVRNKSLLKDTVIRPIFSDATSTITIGKGGESKHIQTTEHPLDYELPGSIILVPVNTQILGGGTHEYSYHIRTPLYMLLEKHMDLYPWPSHLDGFLVINIPIIRTQDGRLIKKEPYRRVNLLCVNSTSDRLPLYLSGIRESGVDFSPVLTDFDPPKGDFFNLVILGVNKVKDKKSKVTDDNDEQGSTRPAELTPDTQKALFRQNKLERDISRRRAADSKRS